MLPKNKFLSPLGHGSETDLHFQGNCLSNTSLIAGTFGRMFVIVRLRRHVRQPPQVAALIVGTLEVILLFKRRALG